MAASVSAGAQSAALASPAGGPEGGSVGERLWHPGAPLAGWPREGRGWELPRSWDGASAWKAVMADPRHLPCLGSDRCETRARERAPWIQAARLGTHGVTPAAPPAVVSFGPHPWWGLFGSQLFPELSDLCLTLPWFSSEPKGCLSPNTHTPRIHNAQPQSHLRIDRDWNIISEASETWGPGPSYGDRQYTQRTWFCGNPAFPKREWGPGNWLCSWSV